MFLFCCFHPWRPKSALPICRITVSSSCTVIFVLTCIACLTLILALFLEPSSGHHYVSFTWKRETTKRNLFRLNQPRISFISDKVCIQTYTAWAGHTFCSNQLNYLSPRVGSHHSNHSKLRTPYSERQNKKTWNMILLRQPLVPELVKTSVIIKHACQTTL